MTSLEDNAVRATTQVKQFGDIVREACLRAFGHVMRRDSGYTGQRTLNVELPEKRDTSMEVYGCSEGGPADGCCDRGRFYLTFIYIGNPIQCLLHKRDLF